MTTLAQGKVKLFFTFAAIQTIRFCDVSDYAIH